MSDLLSSIGFDPRQLLFMLFLSGLVVVFFYSRFLFTLLDPLLFFMLAQVANVAVALAFPMQEPLRWQLLGDMVALGIGFSLNGRPQRRAGRPPLEESSFYDLRLLLMVLAAVLAAANLYLGAKAGFPLFSSDPSRDKFAIYSGGLGLIRRLNMGPYLFLCAGCSLMIVRNVYRRQMAAALVVPTLLIMLSGNKSALLPLILCLALTISHPGLGATEQLRRRSSLYLGLLMAAALVLAVLVAARTEGSLGEGLQFLVLRLLYSADVVFYYVPRREVIARLVEANVFGFLHNAVGEVAGMLHLAVYEEPLGTIIAANETGGPNAQYFVQADIFMGPVLGTIYCFGVGYAISRIRALYMVTQVHSAMAMASILFLLLSCFDMAMEFSLFVSEVFTALLVVLPLYVLILLLRTGFGDVDRIVARPRLWPARVGQG